MRSCILLRMRVFDVQNRPAWVHSASHQQAVKFFRLSQVRRVRQCQQVAAVCYRVRKGEIEFLLVQTGGGRWTFPKGGVEPGLTHAQAAALEAFEEAGVHGRIEETPFARYSYNKRSKNSPLVNAFLCQVMRLVKPQESNRDRTWFSCEKAKRALQKGRTRSEGIELTRTVDRAEIRIRKLYLPTSATPKTQHKDVWQRVSLEPPTANGVMLQHSRAIETVVATYLRKVMRPKTLTGQVVNVPRLTEGLRTTNGLRQKITPIDHPRFAGKARPQ